MNEDKIFKFSEFDFTKYNGVILVQNITEWLRVYLLEHKHAKEIKTTVDKFISETNIDINQLKTLIHEQEISPKINSFKMKIENDMIIFYDFKKNSSQV